MAEQFLLVSGAGRVLQRSSQTVRNYEKLGKLQAQRTADGTRLFRESDVRKLAQELAASTGSAHRPPNERHENE